MADYPVPNNNDWELFFMRMTVMVMAQVRKGIAGNVAAADISACANAVNTYWSDIK